MFRVDWTTRRYRLSDFDEKELKSTIKSWVRVRGFSIIAHPKFDLRKLYWSTAYAIAGSKRALLTTMVNALYVSYRDPILYVFSTSHLPQSCSDIFDEVFAAYSRRHRGEWIEETPLAFSSTLFISSPLSRFESLKVDYRLLVQLEPELDRMEAASEEIHVPEGVSVKVRRSRTITHSVEITHRETEGSQVESGLKVGQLEIIKATVQSEIQRQAGLRFEQTETIEHEISLSGDKNQFYRLVWADFVRRGIVEIHERGMRTELPFNCRERTELQVVPA